MSESTRDQRMSPLLAPVAFVDLTVPRATEGGKSAKEGKAMEDKGKGKAEEGQDTYGEGGSSGRGGGAGEGTCRHDKQTPNTKCVFLQKGIGSLDRDQHIRQLNAMPHVLPNVLSRKLEDMERKRDGVERSKHEMEKRIDTLKDEGKIALVRQYVDRLHGGSNRLTDEFDRKELRNIPLREEEEEEYDQEEEHDSPPPMEGQQLFP